MPVSWHIVHLERKKNNIVVLYIALISSVKLCLYEPPMGVACSETIVELPLHFQFLVSVLGNNIVPLSQVRQKKKKEQP